MMDHLLCKYVKDVWLKIKIKIHTGPLPPHTPGTPHHPQICFSIPTSMCCSCTSTAVQVHINFLLTYFSLEPVVDSPYWNSAVTDGGVILELIGVIWGFS